MKLNISIPSFEETEERIEQLNDTNRTVIMAALQGTELNPLEKFVNENEPAGKEMESKFRSQLKEMLEWVVENNL